MAGAAQAARQERRGARLGRKQRVTNEDWQRAYATCTKHVSKAHVDALLDRTVEQIRRVIAGKRVAYGWSGGKDSSALGFVMAQAGVGGCMLAIAEDLEYPAFLKWAAANGPKHLSIIDVGLDLKWLAKRPHMLFPQDSKTAGQWFRLIQHKAQTKYFKAQELDMIALGRRRADGNYTGKDGSGIYRNRVGVVRYCPLQHWTHEEVLALIRYYGLPLAPIYDWPNGWVVGTGAWPARQWTKGVMDGWSQVYAIDPQVVHRAAGYLASAEKFLRKKEGGR